eukprot:1549789-Rhodomonas_salina.1
MKAMTSVLLSPFTLPLSLPHPPLASFAKLTGGHIKLSWVTGNAQVAKLARVSYPICTASGRAIRLKTRGP